MKVTHLLLISLLIVGVLFVPVASAEIIVDEELSEWVDTSEKGIQKATVFSGSDGYSEFYRIVFPDISKVRNLGYIVFELPSDQGKWRGSKEYIPVGHYPFEYEFNGKTRPGVLYLQRSTNLLGQVTKTKFNIFLNDWDIGTLTGEQYVDLPFIIHEGKTRTVGDLPDNAYIFMPGGYLYPEVPISVTVASGIPWINHLKIEEVNNGYEITLNREIDNQAYKSTILVNKTDEIIHQSTLNGVNEQLWFSQTEVDLVSIISPSGKVYQYPLESDIPEEPTSTLRTGTVTMTDHNGTTISGFDVRAVNYYTGEEYTVSTDTDVATITLPMDRTTTFRNPQTGEYEEVPVGYYTFFVYKPGYKMTSEEGVRISVMPEEYSSYHLGDIIVTSEDGYLTGRHQFQIRSRADLSILQTGTISAQSATTGEWYNATVDNGIATLILPYDTSSAIFPYVGNYYVYATSPGYIPSEYATQISVRPDTQSEIRYILLTPIGGVPEPGNVTLRIQAYSDSWQEIPNAEIHIDGVSGAGWEIWETYTASSAGYAEISVPGNSTYDITVYGQGYYSSSQRVEVGDTDSTLITFILYPTGAPTLTPTTQPTGWVTPPPTTQPSPGIPDEDDKSEGFLMEAVRGISNAFGVGFATGKIILGMLLALAVGFATAKQLRGGAAEFGMGMLGGTMLGVLIGLIPVWVVVVLLLIVGMYIGYRYVGGSNNG